MKTNTPLVTPFSMLVAASSKAGKTKLVRDIIINHYQCFDRPLDEVVWLHHPNAKDEDLFTYLRHHLNVPIQFVEGFPAQDISNQSLFKTNKSSLKCLVLDDIVVSALKSPTFIDLFTIISHHQSVVVIAILQNLHADTSSQRQIMNNIIRNVSYVVLFSDRRQTAACKQIARTYFNEEEYKLLRPFKQLIESKDKYQYMVIDFVDSDIPVKFNSLRPNEKACFFDFSLA